GRRAHDGRRRTDRFSPGPAVDRAAAGAPLAWALARAGRRAAIWRLRPAGGLPRATRGGGSLPGALARARLRPRLDRHHLWLAAGPQPDRPGHAAPWRCRRLRGA